MYPRFYINGKEINKDKTGLIYYYDIDHNIVIILSKKYVYIINDIKKYGLHIETVRGDIFNFELLSIGVTNRFRYDAVKIIITYNGYRNINDIIESISNYTFPEARTKNFKDFTNNNFYYGVDKYLSLYYCNYDTTSHDIDNIIPLCGLKYKHTLLPIQLTNTTMYITSLNLKKLLYTTEFHDFNSNDKYNGKYLLLKIDKFYYIFRRGNNMGDNIHTDEYYLSNKSIDILGLFSDIEEL